MMIEAPEGFCWPAYWKPLPAPIGWLGQIESIEAELRREVPAGHVLHGAACRAVAYNAADVNEFLFVTDRPDVPIAFVHLTFQVERSPKWPYTVVYPDWEAFRAEWHVTEE